jgi:hypothetical protein
VQSVRLEISEDELSVELKWHSKTLGVEDNFLLLCAGVHHRVLRPSNGGSLRTGDLCISSCDKAFASKVGAASR